MNTKNRRSYSRISVDQKLTIFKELINEEPLYIYVVCQRCLYKKYVFCYDENKFQVSIWLGCLIVIYIFLELAV